MKNTNILAVGALTIMSASSIAAPYVADARSQGMGNTGVVSADYLTAPLHNPALGAMYNDNDDVGILLPAFGVNVNDKDDSLTLIDDMESVYEALDSSVNRGDEISAVANARELKSNLDSLNGNAPLTVNAGLSSVIAIPNQYAAVNIFATGYVEAIIVPQVTTSTTTLDTIDDARNVLNDYEGSAVDLVAFGTSEVGLSFARKFEIAEQNFSFGVSPKFQQLVTYSQSPTLQDFELDDYDENEVSKSTFNMDLGAVWYKDAYRVGLTIKDVMKQDIETQVRSRTYTYELTPKAALGLGYMHEFFTVSLDADLTAQKRFKEFDSDDTQFVRIGVEGNAWGWAQLRAGYEMDLKDNLDNSITAGIGISPFDVVSLDIAASYAGESQLGAAANLAFTF